MRIHFEHMEYVHAEASQNPDAIRIVGSAKAAPGAMGDGLAFYVTQRQARVLIEELEQQLRDLKEAGYALE